MFLSFWVEDVVVGINIDIEKKEDEIIFWKISTVFNLKYLYQNFIKLSM